MKYKYVLTFMKPEWETPIAIPGDSISELSDRINKTIEKRSHDVYISVDEDEVVREEIEEVASMLLMKGHFLAQVKYCPKVSIFADDKDHCTLDSQFFYVSSLHPKMLDIIFNVFYGGDRLSDMLSLIDRFQYVYFDPKNKQDWVRKVGYKVEEHFNERLKEFKNSEE